MMRHQTGREWPVSRRRKRACAFCPCPAPLPMPSAGRRLRPVRVRAGGPGPSCPARDGQVSPRCRFFANPPILSRVYGEDEVPVAALSLTRKERRALFPERMVRAEAGDAPVPPRP